MIYQCIWCRDVFRMVVNYQLGMLCLIGRQKCFYIGNCTTVAFDGKD